MLNLTIQIIAILSMLTFMFTSIWGFILLIKIYNQLRYKNYLMEKLTQNTYRLTLNNDNREPAKNDTKAQSIYNPNEKETLEA
ncbi:hypothetical protein LGK97_11640 [Clostridium sp. CS001]|uniref:hypothetical protein n=1 Tax=Clostridium sp. CS001 TaxID=2880648 RepID=UPI001CF4A254|nr:hypothetical protein [Clostridium sp. CS001]MCB2290419.1 hypothetical protein [Clostridium sp. CS001]